MQDTQHLDVNRLRTLVLALHAGDVLCVTHGLVWLTMEGHSRDAWVSQANGPWRVPVDARVWVGTDAQASLKVYRTPATRRNLSRWPLHTVAQWALRLFTRAPIESLRPVLATQQSGLGV